MASSVTEYLRDNDVEGNILGTGLAQHAIEVLMLALTARVTVALYPELANAKSMKIFDGGGIDFEGLKEMEGILGPLSIESSIREFNEAVLKIHRLLTGDKTATLKEGSLSVNAEAVLTLNEQFRQTLEKIKRVLGRSQKGSDADDANSAMLARQDAMRILTVLGLAMCGGGCATSETSVLDEAFKYVKPIVSIPVPDGKILLMGQVQTPAGVVLEFTKRWEDGTLDKEFLNLFMRLTRPMLALYRKDIRTIKEAVANPQNNIKTIGVEFSQNEFEEIKKILPDFEKNIVTGLQHLGYSQEERAKLGDELILILEGPVIYMLLKDKIALNGIEIVGVEDIEAKRKSLEIIQGLKQEIEEIILSMQESHAISEDRLKEWMKSTDQKVRDQNGNLSEQEVEQLARSVFQGEGLLNMGKKVVRLLIELNNSIYSRDPYNARNIFKIHSKIGDGMLVLTGAIHVDGIERNIKEILQEKGFQKEPSTQPKDRAMRGESATKGGIDFDTNFLNIEINRDPETGRALPFSPQQIQQINIQGLTPIIINITPITNLPQLLGGTAPEESVGKISMR